MVSRPLSHLDGPWSGSEPECPSLQPVLVGIGTRRRMDGGRLLCCALAVRLQFLSWKWDNNSNFFMAVKSFVSYLGVSRTE